MQIRTGPNITTVTLDDGGLVILAPTGTVYRGNRTAAALWAALERHFGDVQAAAGEVAGQFGIPQSRVRADLDILIVKLQYSGLVRTER